MWRNALIELPESNVTTCIEFEVNIEEREIPSCRIWITTTTEMKEYVSNILLILEINIENVITNWNGDEVEFIELFSGYLK